MKKLYAAFMVTLLVLSTGCSSVRVRTDFDRDADFSMYRTYSWLPHGKPQRGMMRSELVRKHIVAAVDRELAAAGLTRVSRERADLLVTYYVGARNRVDVTHYGYRYGPWGRYGPGGISVRRYKEGSLVLDLVDRESRQLVWRGWASSVLRGRENLAEDINRSVRELMKRYPPVR